MTLLRADARHLPLADGCVQCVVTSPPYWGLRDYGHTGQIGLEQTPDAYVSELVAVFREVRRVLKDDGVLWLNLGDSYANDAKWGGSSGGKHVAALHGQTGIGRQKTTTGLKAKDLVGIPWRVAFALQAPYYTGRIAREFDRVWLAAMVDGEGCFYVHKRKAGQRAGDGYYRQADTYSPAMEVANTHESIVLRCREIAGCGSIIRQDKHRRQPIYRWTARCDEARQIARELYPYLVAKRQQAAIVHGMPASGERASAAWDAMKALHAGIASDVGCEAPPPCLEPGWYLRSDVIWGKPNPMPESVTDRPTKAHEYVFLLTKAERYYYDAKAIQEQATYDGTVTFGGTAKLARLVGANKQPSGNEKTTERRDNYTHRNARTVWTIATQPYSGSHFATFPEALVERCVLAGSKPHDLVFDPFGGSGTTARVALSLGRRAVCTELNPAYLSLARERTHVTLGLPLEVA